MSRVYLLAAAEEERKRRQVRVTKRVLKEQGSPLELPDEEFLNLFHLTKTLFKELCTVLKPYLPARQYSNAIPLDIKILTALAFYGQGGFQKAVGTNLLGLSQTSVHDCLRDVTNALNSPKILRKYIKFPRTNQELDEVSRGFFQDCGIPGVVGCIDGTHVAIIRPCENEGAYFNRKNYHSINVLIICDSKLNILYVDASFGGACHDAHVWGQCPVNQFMQQMHGRGEGPHYLLGDTAYEQRPWLMTPVLRAGRGAPEEYYNTVHAHARAAVDRCVAVLKGRWQCMLAHKILTALAFYGQGGFQKAVGTNLLGLSQTSVHDCLRDVTNALNSPKILRKYIKFPRTNQELDEVSRGSGDTAYEQRPWLMTPVLRAGRGAPEEYYNTVHAHARAAVDRCVAVLKGRWQCMLAHKVLRYSPIKAGKMVNACVVLHNFVNRANLALDLQSCHEELRQDSQQQILEAVDSHDIDGSRQALIGRLWGTHNACMYQPDYNRHCGNQYFT